MKSLIVCLYIVCSAQASTVSQAATTSAGEFSSALTNQAALQNQVVGPLWDRLDAEQTGHNTTSTSGDIAEEKIAPAASFTQEMSAIQAVLIPRVPEMWVVRSASAGVQTGPLPGESVPEPSSFLMMLIGFTAISGFLSQTSKA